MKGIVNGEDWLRQYYVGTRCNGLSVERALRLSGRHLEPADVLGSLSQESAAEVVILGSADVALGTQSNNFWTAGLEKVGSQCLSCELLPHENFWACPKNCTLEASPTLVYGWVISECESPSAALGSKKLRTRSCLRHQLKGGDV